MTDNNLPWWFAVKLLSWAAVVAYLLHRGVHVLGAVAIAISAWVLLHTAHWWLVLTPEERRQRDNGEGMF